MSEMAKKPKTGAVFRGQKGIIDVRSEESSSLLQWTSDPDKWTIRDVAAGQAIFRQGGQPKCLFEIVSGTVKLSQVTEDGRQIILGFPSSGELVGLTGGKEYRFAAETMTSSRLRLVRWTAFCRQLLQDRAAREKLLGWLDMQEKRTLDHIALLTLQSPLSKVATFLLGRISQHKRGSANHVAVDLPMTQRDIANYLEITAETCSRTMRRLREDAVIAAPNRSGDRKSLNILDRKRLEDLVNASIL